jgi:hypothetical protein
MCERVSMWEVCECRVWAQVQGNECECVKGMGG